MSSAVQQSGHVEGEIRVPGNRVVWTRFKGMVDCICWCREAAVHCGDGVVPTCAVSCPRARRIKKYDAMYAIVTRARVRIATCVARDTQGTAALASCDDRRYRTDGDGTG